MRRDLHRLASTSRSASIQPAFELEFRLERIGADREDLWAFR